MHSGIYTGWVRHRRYTPTQHQLRYQIYMMYLDLSEIDEVLNLSPWWSRKPWRPARFERSDFLGDPALSLDSAVRERIYNETGEAHIGPIRMLANLRYLGFNMNPITSYYCFDKHERLQTIVADVHNTPGMNAPAMCWPVIRTNASSVFFSQNRCMFRRSTRLVCLTTGEAIRREADSAFTLRLAGMATAQKRWTQQWLWNEVTLRHRVSTEF